MTDCVLFDGGDRPLPRHIHAVNEACQNSDDDKRVCNACDEFSHNYHNSYLDT